MDRASVAIRAAWEAAIRLLVLFFFVVVIRVADRNRHQRLRRQALDHGQFLSLDDLEERYRADDRVTIPHLVEQILQLRQGVGRRRVRRTHRQNRDQGRHIEPVFRELLARAQIRRLRRERVDLDPLDVARCRAVGVAVRCIELQIDTVGQPGSLRVADRGWQDDQRWERRTSRTAGREQTREHRYRGEPDCHPETSHRM